MILSGEEQARHDASNVTMEAEAEEPFNGDAVEDEIEEILDDEALEDEAGEEHDGGDDAAEDQTQEQNTQQDAPK